MYPRRSHVRGFFVFHYFPTVHFFGATVTQRCVHFATFPFRGFVAGRVL